MGCVAGIKSVPEGVGVAGLGSPVVTLRSGGSIDDSCPSGMVPNRRSYRWRFVTASVCVAGSAIAGAGASVLRRRGRTDLGGREKGGGKHVQGEKKRKVES